jgi:hypothetical protein
VELIFSMPHVFVPGSDVKENAAILRITLEYLIAVDLDYLQRHATPSLYDDPSVYHRTVEWEPIPAVQLRKYGDCKSLAAWKIAEYRFRGIPAKPVFRYRPRGGGFYDYHILIQLPGERFEDPSKIKGMDDSENAPVGRLPLDNLLLYREVHGSSL